jgi:menaquinone-dependent protoporphyrinogen oxidase
MATSRPSASVLVAYGSRNGSTQEVAEAIADVLRMHGRSVDVRAAGDVRDVATYGTVVLGGALYTGRWHKDARRLLRRLRTDLGTRDLAVFAMGPRTLDEAEVSASRAQLDRALARAPELHPEWVAIFGGVIRPERLRFPLNWMPACDARDWSAIRDWAANVATGARQREVSRV